MTKPSLGAGKSSGLTFTAYLHRLKVKDRTAGETASTKPASAADAAERKL
jgi:hypothetical protein